MLHVANMCRDIPMSQEEMQFLIEKILRYTMIPLTLILILILTQVYIDTTDTDIDIDLILI